ncbi:MAG: tetratricopeptide repeat protein [Armatimonadota bacterium]|nr:tetratricopeptide repeat protein [Armatimonadota bacterium]
MNLSYRISLMWMLVLAALLILLVSPPGWAARPVVAFFDLAPVDEATAPIAEQATKTFKTLMRQGGRVDIVQVTPELPSVRLAVADSKITESELAKLSDPSVRQKLAPAIGAQYLLSGGISMKGDKITIAVELQHLQSGKKWQEAAEVTANGSDPTTSLNNGIMSAANTVSVRLNDGALAALPAAMNKPATASKPSEILSAVEASEPKNRADLAKIYLAEGKTAAAITELRRAINTDPKNAELRLLLAQAYVKRGLFDDAMRELTRASQIDPGNEGVVKGLVQLYEAKGTPDEIIKVYQELIAKKPDDVRLRLALGDLLWRKAKIDDAIKVFEGVSTIDPKNTVAHDRLARCYAAKSQFTESLKHLDELAKLEPTPEPAVIAERYLALMIIVEGEIKSLSGQFDQGAQAFESEMHTREQYYELIRSLVSRADLLTRYMDKIPNPPEYVSAHGHRVLACSLLSQAGVSLLSYLETNREDRQAESQLYLSEAKKELTLASSKDVKPAPQTDAVTN